MSGRRSFLAFTASAVAATTVLLTAAAQARAERGALDSAPLEHPDAELIALCADFMANNAETDAWNASPADDDDYSDELGDRWHDALAKMSITRARTIDGFRAKARAAHPVILQAGSPECWGSEEKAALAVLADLAGRA